MSWTPRRLETPRLVLQPTGEGEAEADPASNGEPTTRSGLPNQWRIAPKHLEQVVGLIGFIRWETEAATAEIGFGIVQAMWGQGYMTEACRAVVDYGFSDMALRRIEARCQITNPASARVLEKIGMRREAMVRGRVHSKAPEEDFWLYAIERGGGDEADR
ncbi:MAG: GNAT family N-acetyltransferase [Nitrospirota bacterium]